MRHKTIYVNFHAKKVMGVDEIEFISPWAQVQAGVQGLMSSALRPLRLTKEENKIFSPSKLDHSIAQVQQAVAVADDEMNQAGLFNVFQYDKTNKRFAEEALSVVEKLRMLEAMIKEQADVIEQAVTDNYDIVIRKDKI